MTYMSRDGLVEVWTNTSSLFDTLEPLSQRSALAGNVSSYTSDYLYQTIRRHCYVIGYY